MARTAAVTTRMLAPEPSDHDGLKLLYREVEQLPDGPVPMKVEWLRFSPAKAQELVSKAMDSNAEIRQRNISIGQTRRWRTLYLTGRFVNFLPNGPICMDDNGLLMNGMHRLSALARLEDEREFGFMVVKHCPQWMFKFFDTGKNRTIKDVFHISGRNTGPQTPSAMKLGMRYEEFLAGMRSASGWRHWNANGKDEHNDTDEFLGRREEFQDWYAAAEKVNRNAKLLIPSVMAFRFYQGLAWPEGDEKLQAFCNSLITGEMLTGQSPVLKLREWSKDAYFNKAQIFGKRELHLLLLMRAFEQFCQGSRINSLVWAYGQPMAMPYHPDGHEVAVKTARRALDDLDAEAASK